MDIPDNYELIVVPSSSRGTAFLVCKDCGALVVDTEPHEAYHQRQGAVASEAYRASAWHTPIG